MSSADDIERQIMMEMEKEIQGNQEFQNFESHNPPPFTITPMRDDFLSTHDKEAEDRLQAELQARLQRKQHDDPQKGLGFPAFSFDSGLPPELQTASAADDGAQQRQAEEEEARRRAEEEARAEAEQETRRQAEEAARAEAEEEARWLEEEEARRAAEEAARREAEEEARRLAEAEAQRQAEEQARREAEEQARREAEEEARREAEEEAHRLAEEEARRQAEAEAQRLAEEQARREAEEAARRQAEEEARRQAEAEAQRLAEEQARREAEEQARREAEEQARREAEEAARRQAEEEARRLAEAEAVARRQAEEQARREAEEQARREAEQAALRRAEELARQKAEEEARRQAEEEARRQAEEAKRKAEEEARRRAEEQARREAEEAARRQAEEEARRQAEEEARRKAEEEARRQAEAEAQRLAEEQARREAEEEARRKAEEEARRQAEEQARRLAEAEAQRQAEEEARRKAEEQARREAEEAARRQAEEEARRKAEEQARREAEEAARRQAEEEARRQAEEQARREAEQAALRRAEELARQKAEEEARRQAEEEARRQAEEEARRKAEEEARRQAEAEAQRLAEEQARREAEEEARRQAEEAARRQAEEEARRQAEEEARRQAEEEARRQAEEEARRQAEEEAKRQAEEQARREAEEEERRLAHERALEEIRRQARERVMAEYAAKGINLSGAASPLTSPRSTSVAAPAPREAPPVAVTQPTTPAASTAAPAPAPAPAAAPSPPPASSPSSPASSRSDSPKSRQSGASDRSSDPDRAHALPSYAQRGTEDADNNNDDDDGAGDDLENHSMVSDESDLRSEATRYGFNVLEASRNDNGICARPGGVQESEYPSRVPDDLPLEAFEESLERELSARGLSQDAIQRGQVCVQRFDTVREPGKCLRPSAEEASGPVPDHAKIQLGFFSAKQSIIYSQYTKRRTIAVRERRCEGRERSLSTLQCYYESEVLRDPALTVDDEDFPHNAPQERLYTKEVLHRGGGEATETALSAISYGDPIQVWESASGAQLAAAAEEQDQKQLRRGKKEADTSRRLWGYDVDTRKPVPAMRTFTGGYVICVEAANISSQVSAIHGVGTDPLVLCAAIYSVTDKSHTKVSESFYFDTGLDIFYPQKQRKEKAKDQKVVAFVPAEFYGTLYLIVRVYRPCTEDFETFVDLYIRTDKYKPVHVAPMKQETLLLSQTSDVFEELGWFYAPCNNGKLLTKTLTTKKLYRKPFSDSEVVKLIHDERSRNALKTVPVDFTFRLSDLTKHEVSFPSETPDAPLPQENESLVSLQDPDVPGAQPYVFRYAPCCIPILNSGYFTTYNNVYYFRLSRMRVQYVGSLRSVPSSHHTYVVSLCIKEKDDSLNEEGALPCIYGRGLNNLSMDTVAWSSSVRASNDVTLSDEFKIQLPLNLTNRHHIFLTLYATYQKKSPPTAGQPRVYKVGYAAFPLKVNDVVQVRDKADIRFVGVDQAAAASAGGYLAAFEKAMPEVLLNGGEPVLQASSQTKTTVHASNRTMAAVFSQCAASLAEVRRQSDVLAVSGRLRDIPVAPADPHRNVISLIANLPTAEVLAFYPMLFSYALALIGSASDTVSLASRTHMLDVLLLISNKTQRYDTTEQTMRRRYGTTSLAAVFPRTTVASVLYHFFSNDVLFEGSSAPGKTAPAGTRYRVYAGLAETWLNLLNAKPPQPPAAPPARKGAGQPAAGSSRQPPPPRNIDKEMSDLSWFLFDAILRSVFLWADEHINVKRSELFDPSLYDLFGSLCVRAIERLGHFNEPVLVGRVALFVRGLFKYGDRGQVLKICDRVARHLEEQEHFESLCHFFKYILEDPDAIYLLLPSAATFKPVFLSGILVRGFYTLLVHKTYEVRTMTVSVLYDFLCRLANDPLVPSENLSCIASQFFELVVRVGPHWKAVTQATDKTPAETFLHDKRRYAMVMLWIIYYTPRTQYKVWLSEESEPKNIAGVMQIVSDSQALFRYSTGVGKCPHALPEEQVAELAPWDARSNTMVVAIGTALAHIFLRYIPRILQTVRDDGANACVFPFFVLLESIMHLGSSTVSLQMSSAASYEALGKLFPEIISNKAKMSAGMVLLTFRLMSSCCQYVRGTAGSAFLFMCQTYFSWKNSLSKIKSLTANALVSVAESKARDLRLAGRFIELQFDDLIDRAKIEEEDYVAPSPDFATRYADDSNAPGGDAQMHYKHDIKELFVSVKRNLPISRYLLDNTNRDVEKPKFSKEFEGMTATVLSLFDDVLRLQVDDSMKFKEAKIAAYFEVFRNFTRQNALKEALKWLYRLHDAHKANNDLAEAGMVLVFIAAMCFRITEVFYFAKGKDSKGARMPYAIFTHVFWQDYVRILPELEQLLPADTVYAIVSEMYVCPDDPCFTVDGQIRTLRDAAELQDKGHYYEFSLATIGIVDRLLLACGDYGGAASVCKARATWCTAIADRTKRENNCYFMLWARMEREESAQARRERLAEDRDSMVGEKPRGLPGAKPLRRVYKMPPRTTLESFRSYAQSYITSLFPDESLVVMTEELTETQPALPEPDTKRKRIAAVHRPPNHCLVTVSEVQPHFRRGVKVPPDGYDKTMHLVNFEDIVHVCNNAPVSAAAGARVDVMKQQMSISTFALERAFPSTTSAIDVDKINQVLLDPFETAVETLAQARETIAQAPENERLVTVLRAALSANGMPPGAYVKVVIGVMSDHSEVIHAIRGLCKLARAKMEVCEKMQAIEKAPEDYALVLKAVTDMECYLIAMDSPEDSVADSN